VPFRPSADPAQIAHSLLQYMGRRSLAAGEYLWRRGNEANDCYIIEKGTLRVSAPR
jgi:CRP-like cAMP-binding protein